MTDKFVKRGTKQVIEKDPGDSLDYVVDFTKFLTPDTDIIASFDVAVTGGLVWDEPSSSHDGQKVTVWLSGGDLTVDGEYASATVRITTTSTPPRVLERTMFFNVLQK